ncbi:snaclec agkisacutacin subunit A-like [Branchiostoma floridae x Branchiostoma belcheri]
MVLNPLQGLSSSPWQSAFYGENKSAFVDFKVVNSTPTYLPSTNSIVTTEALPTTVTSLSTTDVNEFTVVNSTPTYLPSKNSIVTTEAFSTTVTSLSTTALRCQTGWSEYNNHCYKLMTDKTCWSKAKKRCAKHGAILATIKDADENSFIADLIVNAPEGRVLPSVWIGLYKVDTGGLLGTFRPGQWEWIDGSALGYENWAPGQPNYLQPCGTVYSKTGKAWRLGRKRYRGQWDDTICSMHYPTFARNQCKLEK